MNRQETQNRLNELEAEKTELQKKLLPTIKKFPFYFVTNNWNCVNAKSMNSCLVLNNLHSFSANRYSITSVFLAEFLHEITAEEFSISLNAFKNSLDKY